MQPQTKQFKFTRSEYLYVTPGTCTVHLPCSLLEHFIYIQEMKSTNGHMIPSEADSNSPCHDISHILWNPPIHCCVCKSQPYYPILSQTNSAYVRNTQFNITLPTTRISKWSLPFTFSNQNYVFYTNLSCCVYYN